jgi:hypothetical protein
MFCSFESKTLVGGVIIEERAFLVVEQSEL